MGTRNSRLAAAAILALVIIVPGLTAVAASRPGTPLAAPAEGPSEAVPYTPPSAGEEGAEGPTSVTAWLGPPARAEVYASQVSVVPGERIDLHVSTPAKKYEVRVYREATAEDGAHRELTKYRLTERKGVDQRTAFTMDDRSTPRANWRVTDSIRTTKAWKPGVYTIRVTDSTGSQGTALVVVRSPTISSGAPLLVVPVLTYQAYNNWGGASSYIDARHVRSYRVSFDRPYISGPGLWWTTRDAKLAGWLATALPGLQYTTDYDLSLSPPPAFPKMTVLERHTEYVTKAAYDWIEKGVRETGEMGLANFGANTLYWQVRLEPATTGTNAGTTPREMVIYRNDGNPVDPTPTDPVDGPTTTTRWRDAPVARPEGELLGAQYKAMLGTDSNDRWPMTVDSSMPWSLLEGTGWTAGTTFVANLMTGEGDESAAGPDGATTTEILTSIAVSPALEIVHPASTLRTFPSGGRVFNASTLGWGSLLPPAEFDPGVSDESFGTFTRNILYWVAGESVSPIGR
jgi:hypothetical protein